LQTTTSKFKKVVTVLSQIQGVETIIMFGSYATFRERRASDIDLLLVFADAEAARNADAHVIDVASKHAERFVSISCKGREELERDPSFAARIFAEGLIVYQTPTKRESAYHASSILDARPFVIYSVRLPVKDAKKISYKLLGRTGKKYVYKGLVEQFAGKSLGPGVYMIPQNMSRKFEAALDEFKAQYSKIQVYVPAFQAFF